MVLRVVERGEVVPVVLDLGTVGDVEAERAEERLDALQRARDRMQAADCRAAAGQRDVERLGGELRAELRVRERGRGAPSSAASRRCLGGVDRARPLPRAPPGGSLPSVFSCSVSAPVLPR